jgi:hypothetical protein
LLKNALGGAEKQSSADDTQFGGTTGNLSDSLSIANARNND